LYPACKSDLTGKGGPIYTRRSFSPIKEGESTKREEVIEMTSSIFGGITRKMSALTGALALVATLAVLMVSGAGAANAQVNEAPGAFGQQIQATICSVLRSAINEFPGASNALGTLVERICGPGTVAE